MSQVDGPGSVRSDLATGFDLAFLPLVGNPPSFSAGVLRVATECPFRQCLYGFGIRDAGTLRKPTRVFVT